MTKNGCFNRAPLRETAIVQSGWIDTFNHDEQCYTRIPVMIEIPDNMSKRCVYSRDKKDDPRCVGCKEMEL